MIVRLVKARDKHFAWMAGNGRSPFGLHLPPGGIESPQGLEMLRDLAAEVRPHPRPASWLIVSDGEVVGLCSYKHLPAADGTVEFGYGIAQARRGQGLGTAAVGELVNHVRRDKSVHRLIALTAPGNFASERVLERCGFTRDGRSFDPDDGLVLIWQFRTQTKRTPAARLIGLFGRRSPAA